VKIKNKTLKQRTSNYFIQSFS